MCVCKLHSVSFSVEFWQCIYVSLLHFGLLTNIFATYFQAMTPARMGDQSVNKKDLTQERFEPL